jgi:hydroxypyruvate isomerase
MNNSHGGDFAPMHRRRFLAGAAGGAAIAAFAPGACATAADAKPARPALKGRIKQAACRSAFGKNVPLEKMCEVCVELGLHGIDFVAPADWPTLKKYDLTCPIIHSHSLEKALNRRENHDECLAAIRKSIELAAAAGLPSVICLSGNRAGLADDAGATACVEGLKKIAPFAEEKKVTLCMELLNSKRDHKDYQCDRTAWGADVCRRVGSPRVKLLYDIYHMQVQEGDVIAAIRENIKYIGHFHTAGVPGRHEVDESQELYYPAIMRAIADLGFQGYVTHEYTPTGDPVESLRKGVAICDV